MPLESAVFVHDLVQTNPTGPDGLGQADDHLRLIKAVLQTTFPNMTGALTAALADLNNGTTPIGGIILWHGTIASIPANWHLCDGTAGTPNLVGKVVICSDSATGTYPPLATGGSVAAIVSDSQGAHTHGGSTGGYVLTIADIPAHNHPVVDPGHAHTTQFGSVNGTGGWPYISSSSAGTALNPATTSVGTGISTSNTGGGNGHAHTISSDGAHTHSVTPTLPPYTALAYIMRIS